MDEAEKQNKSESRQSAEAPRNPAPPPPSEKLTNETRPRSTAEVLISPSTDQPDSVKNEIANSETPAGAPPSDKSIVDHCSLKIEPAEAAADPFFSGRKHYPALDGLRALAIIGVICLHFGGSIKQYQLAAAGPLALYLFKAFRHGAWGVDLFFVLSGYLITGILLQSRGQQNYFRNFYARRTLRIFPLYYGVLLTLLVILPSVLGHIPATLSVAYHRQAWLWTYTTNIETARKGMVFGNFIHFWTLAIEEQFYLVWPLLLFLTPQRRLSRLIVCLIIFINAARVIFWAADHSQVAWYWLWSFTPFRADTLLAGAGLAVLQTEGRLAAYRRAFAVAFCCTLPIILLFYFGASHKWQWMPAPLIPHLAFAPILFGSALGLILTSHPASWLLKALSFRPLRSIGKYSYAMYVFHLIYLPLEVRWLPYSLFSKALYNALLGLLAYYSSAVAIAFGLAFCSYHLYEKHFLKLKKYFPERAAAGVPPQ